MIKTENLTNESQILFKCLLGYKLNQSDFKNQEWQRLFKLASANRVLYSLAKNLSQAKKASQTPYLKKNINQILVEGDKRLDKLKKTLRLVKKVLTKAKISFLIVKTEKTLSYITFDLDVLVHPKDFKKAEELMRMSEARINEYQPKDQSDIYIPGLERIDLHKHFYWHSSPFLDQKFLWQDYRESQIEGVKCLVPSKTVDWTLTVLNLLYERYYIPLLEFLYLVENSSEVEFAKVFKQAEKHGWIEAFKEFLEILIGLERLMFPKSRLEQALSKQNILAKAIPPPVRFPFIFPTIFTIKIFWERIKRQRRLDLYQLAYYFFAKSRFYLTKGTRVPVYGDWFEFNKLKW